MPTAATTTFSAHRCDPLYEGLDARELNVAIKASQTIARGTVVAEVDAAPGTYAAYASGASDGTQTPKGILVYDVVTDSSKNITAYGEFATTSKVTPIYVGGYFDIADLTTDGSAGITATAVAALNGLVINGVASGGVYTAGCVKF